MNNTSINSPTFRPFNIDEDLTSKTPSGAVGGTLRALDIYAPGDVEVIDINGVTRKRTFAPSGGPIRWIVQIAKVTSNTTVDIANLDGLV